MKLSAVVLLILLPAFHGPMSAQTLNENPGLDARVRKFLSEHAGQWHDMNVPRVDAELLYDLVIRGDYKSALEIGTSTGYSGIYIAWALSKTGGRLITIDIDEGRHRKALENFREAGLSEYIDARLADAHTLVRELEGPFDFVFSDADKYWYKNYFLDVDPKLLVGGCFATHNIYEEGRRSREEGYSQDYREFVRSHKNYETTLNSDGNGVLISYKTAE